METFSASRTLTLDDLTPQEIASLFCELNNEDQAEFFNEVASIARGWPGAGWCQQSCDIVRARALSDLGRSAIKSLSEHLILLQEEVA